MQFDRFPHTESGDTPNTTRASETPPLPNSIQSLEGRWPQRFQSPEDVVTCLQGQGFEELKARGGPGYLQRVFKSGDTTVSFYPEDAAHGFFTAVRNARNFLFFDAASLLEALRQPSVDSPEFELWRTQMALFRSIKMPLASGHPSAGFDSYSVKRAMAL